MVGRSALAGALLVMTSPAIPLAAFVGHAELRARRLLGTHIDEPKAPRAVWAASSVYSWLPISLAGCLFPVLVALTRYDRSSGAATAPALPLATPADLL